LFTSYPPNDIAVELAIRVDQKTFPPFQRRGVSGFVVFRHVRYIICSQRGVDVIGLHSVAIRPGTPVFLPIHTDSRAIPIDTKREMSVSRSSRRGCLTSSGRETKCHGEHMTFPSLHVSLAYETSFRIRPRFRHYSEIGGNQYSQQNVKGGRNIFFFNVFIFLVKTRKSTRLFSPEYALEKG
jgi:hypothetical protein